MYLKSSDVLSGPAQPYSSPQCNLTSYPLSACFPQGFDVNGGADQTSLSELPIPPRHSSAYNTSSAEYSTDAAAVFAMYSPMAGPQTSRIPAEGPVDIYRPRFDENMPPSNNMIATDGQESKASVRRLSVEKRSSLTGRSSIDGGRSAAESGLSVGRSHNESRESTGVVRRAPSVTNEALNQFSLAEDDLFKKLSKRVLELESRVTTLSNRRGSSEMRSSSEKAAPAQNSSSVQNSSSTIARIEKAVESVTEQASSQGRHLEKLTEENDQLKRRLALALDQLGRVTRKQEEISRKHDDIAKRHFDETAKRHFDVSIRPTEVAGASGGSAHQSTDEPLRVSEPLRVDTPSSLASSRLTYTRTSRPPSRNGRLYSGGASRSDPRSGSGARLQGSSTSVGARAAARTPLSSHGNSGFGSSSRFGGSAKYSSASSGSTSSRATTPAYMKSKSRVAGESRVGGESGMSNARSASIAARTAHSRKEDREAQNQHSSRIRTAARPKQQTVSVPFTRPVDLNSQTELIPQALPEASTSRIKLEIGLFRDNQRVFRFDVSESLLTDGPFLYVCQCQLPEEFIIDRVLSLGPSTTSDLGENGFLTSDLFKGTSVCVIATNSRTGRSSIVFKSHKSHVEAPPVNEDEQYVSHSCWLSMGTHSIVGGVRLFYTDVEVEKPSGGLGQSGDSAAAAIQDPDASDQDPDASDHTPTSQPLTEGHVIRAALSDLDAPSKRVSSVTLTGFSLKFWSHDSEKYFEEPDWRSLLKALGVIQSVQ